MDAGEKLFNFFSTFFEFKWKFIPIGFPRGELVWKIVLYIHWAYATLFVFALNYENWISFNDLWITASKGCICIRRTEHWTSVLKFCLLNLTLRCFDESSLVIYSRLSIVWNFINNVPQMSISTFNSTTKLRQTQKNTSKSSIYILFIF